MLLIIEKLIYGGDGLARLPADDRGRGKAVFVPFVLAGEEIAAALTEEKPGFARARVEAIAKASPHRVPPGCQYFGRCGGCHYQHAGYDYQLEIKKEILRENLRRIAKLELECDIQAHPSPPWHYRNRSRLQVRLQPEFVAGYFKLESHEVLPVEECPISSTLINQGIDALWQSGRAGNVAEGVREVEFFANAEDTQLLVVIFCDAGAKRAKLRVWAEQLLGSMPEIAGLAAFRQAHPSSQSSGSEEKLLSMGDPFLTYRTEHAAHRVSAGAFFQTNRQLIDQLVKIVTLGRSGDLALDLYAGVGLFSTALAATFRNVVSVESSQISAADLKHNLPPNAEVVQASTRQYLDQLESNKTGRVVPHFHKPDLVVVDPPRGGLGENLAVSLAKMAAPRMTYVSCDPATLARDLVPLVAAGYRVEQAHMVDLFPQTYHLESVLHLVR